jgi:hypothetical protein
MRVVIQKAIVKVIQKAIIERRCDKCNSLLNKQNYAQTYWDDGKKEVCKVKVECNPFHKDAKHGWGKVEK